MRGSLLFLLAAPGCADSGLYPLAVYTSADGLAAVEVAPNGVSFGLAAPGAEVTEKVFITSAGSERVLIESAYLDQWSDGAFVVADKRLPKMVQPGESFELMVTFQPAAQGEFTGTIVVEASAEGEPMSLEVDVGGLGCTDDDHDGTCE